LYDEPEVEKIPVVHRLGKAVVKQLSDNKLSITKADTGIDRDFTSIFIGKSCAYYTIEIVNYKTYQNFGWSAKDDDQFKSWVGDLGGGSRKYSIANFSGKNNSQKWIFNNLSGNGRVLTAADRSNNNGETVKVSRTDEYVEFSRNGQSIHKYMFKAGDSKDLYPALDLHYPGDEYIITLYDEPEEVKIPVVHRLGKAVVKQLSENKFRITKADTGIDRDFTSIFIEKACDYYTIEIVNYKTYQNFGWSAKDDAQFKSWVGDLGGGNRKNSIANFSGKNNSQKWIFNNLSGNGRVLTAADRSNNNGETVYVYKTDEYVEFGRDGKSIHKYWFKAGDSKDLYPALDLHYPGDEYIITLYTMD